MASTKSPQTEPSPPRAEDAAPGGEGTPLTDEQFAGHDPLAGQPPPEDARPIVIPRAVQVLGLAVSLALVWTIARAAGQVVLLFVVAAVIALILNPVVTFLHRRGLRRGLSVLCVYLAFFLTLGAAGYLLATPVSNQVKAFNRDIPHLRNQANKTLGDAQRLFDRNGVHVQIVKPGKTALQSLSDRLAQGSSSIVSFTTDLVKTVVTTGLSLILIFVLSVYMLIYGPEIGALVRRVMPPSDGSPEDDYPSRVQRAVSGYVRGQLLFSVAMGTGAGGGLWLYGVLGIFPDGGRYAVAFGVFFGLMELIPFVGPVLGAIPPVLVALFEDPLTGLWVALLFLALQQLEGHVVAPQIFSRTLRINPLLVIFTLTVGGAIYGIVGALLALPIAAVLRETGIYLSRHAVLEPWHAERPPRR